MIEKMINKTNKKRSGKKPDSILSSIFLFLILLILGFILSLQIRSTEESRKRVEAGRSDYNYYLALLVSELEYTEQKQNEIEELQIKKNEILEKALMDAGYVEFLDEYQRTRRLAGFTEVRGPGVRVTLDDLQLKDKSFPTSTSIIHDLDIRQVVDIFRSSGAIAISVNTERIVSTSELTCNGPTVQINKNKYPVPYVIEAVGDVVLMKKMLEEDRYLQGRIISNISFNLEIVEDVIIPGFSQYDRVEHYIDALKGGGIS